MFWRLLDRAEAEPDRPGFGSLSVGTRDVLYPIRSDFVNVRVRTLATLTQSAHATTSVRAPSHHAMWGAYLCGGGDPFGLST